LETYKNAEDRGEESSAFLCASQRPLRLVLFFHYKIDRRGG
jgi:hypothetical protein